MPRLLLLYEQMMLDRRHQESQEWSETKSRGRRGGYRDDRKEEISGRRSQRRSRVVVQFGASVLPQWLLCGVWQ